MPPDVPLWAAQPSHLQPLRVALPRSLPLSLCLLPPFARNSSAVVSSPSVSVLGSSSARLLLALDCFAAGTASDLTQQILPRYSPGDAALCALIGRISQPPKPTITCPPLTCRVCCPQAVPYASPVWSNSLQEPPSLLEIHYYTTLASPHEVTAGSELLSHQPVRSADGNSSKSARHSQLSR